MRKQRLTDVEIIALLTLAFVGVLILVYIFLG